MNPDFNYSNKVFENQDTIEKAMAIISNYRIMRAYVRYYLNYTPEVLKKMTISELAQAYNDILFVRKREAKNKF